MGEMESERDIEDFEIATEFLGPYPSVEEALQGVAIHVSASLRIEAISYHRSPSILSHDIILQDDGYYAPVVEVTQHGLVGRCRRCAE